MIIYKNRHSFLLVLLTFWGNALNAENDRAPEPVQIRENWQLQRVLEEYQATMEQTQALYGEFSIKLLEPLQGQAKTLREQGKEEDAIEVLNHAIHILRRAEGVYTHRQLDLIDELTEISIEDDKPLRANMQKEFSYFISSRFYGEDSPDLIPETYRLVKWYMRTGQLKKAMELLEKTLDSMESQGRTNEPRLIEAHLMLASVRRLRGLCCSEKALGEALQIVKDNSELSLDLSNELYLGLADAFLVSSKFQEAERYYNLVENQNSEPSPIVMGKSLDKRHQNFRTIYRTNEDAIGPTLVRLSREEQLVANEQPPQKFFVRMSEHNKKFDIMNIADSANSRSRTPERIGHPFQFYTEQVEHLLRFSKNDKERLKRSELTLDFTVNRDGSTANVEIIETNAPSRINKLMQQVLSKATFRPALEAGQPVIRDNFKLTQRFF